MKTEQQRNENEEGQTKAANCTNAILVHNKPSLLEAKDRRIVPGRTFLAKDVQYLNFYINLLLNLNDLSCKPRSPRSCHHPKWIHVANEQLSGVQYRTIP